MDNTSSGFVKYGEKLEALGKRFQDENMKLKDIVGACMDLGLIITFRVEPNPSESVDETVDL